MVINNGGEYSMANRFQKFIYYLSAEAPVLMILAIVWLIEKSIWTKPVRISWAVPLILMAVAILLIIVFYAFFKKAKTELTIMEIAGSEYKCIDGWLVAYVISYLLPFSSLVLGDVIWIVLGVVLVLLMIILVFSDHVTPHPMLFFRGYHFYELKVEGLASDYKVISKKQIRNVKDIRKISRIFEFLLIRMG